MRAGGVSAFHQTFSPEAASVLKHSLTLARRRGHAQVTPLHVAATLLSSKTTSVFKRACLKSQPPPPYPPLQCKALELCFSVALNRLQSTPAAVVLHAQPALSNALVAALKRAQAHKRRGASVDQQQQQQQSVIPIKVELEQLILSILDDPSVSRVMIEAGFSSTSVKNCLEESNSGGIHPTPNSPQKEATNSPWDSSSSSSSQLVTEILLRKKRKNAVIIGDSSSAVDALASDFMRKLEGGDLPEGLKSARLIKLHFSSSVPLELMKREEVETSVADLKRKIQTFRSGVVIYAGDLKWAVVEGEQEDGDRIYYSPVDHLVTELGKLIDDCCPSSSSSKVWLLGTASYETYFRCQMRKPSLDLQWNLHPISVPSSGLGGFTLLHPPTTTTTRCQDHHPKLISFPQMPFWLKRPQAEEDTMMKSCRIEFSFSSNSSSSNNNNGGSAHRSPNLDSLNEARDGNEARITLGLGNNGSEEESGADFGEMLRENLPWHCDSIPLILRALSSSSRDSSNRKLILIHGNDSIGKRRLAAGISSAIFGSSDSLFCIKMRDTEEAVKKREKMLYRALRDDNDAENLVVLIEDVEYADPEFAKFLVERNSTRRREIFILTTAGETITTESSVIQMKLVVSERTATKRKADWDLPNTSSSKSPSSHRKNSSSNNLDLNVTADDDDDDDAAEFIAPEMPTQKTLEIIQKSSSSISFTLNKNREQQNRAIEMFMSKIRRHFDGVIRRDAVNFSVETGVLEEILRGSGFYLNNGLFEQWLKEVFQPCLQRVENTTTTTIKEGERVSIRLCLGGRGGESGPENGFMGTNLPKIIQVHWTD